MRDLLDELEAWWRDGAVVGVGTVVGTWQSAPRPPGAAMAVGPGGRVVGSVSGGCVEADVYRLAEETCSTARPVLQRYGVSTDDAASVGLTCGGTIDIFVEPVSNTIFPELGAVIDDIRSDRAVAVATVVATPRNDMIGQRLVIRSGQVTGTLGSDRLDAAVATDAQRLLAQGVTSALRYGPDGQRPGDVISVFVASYAPKPRMIVFGAIDFAAALARLGTFLGYRVTVCDARPSFATDSRFPTADEVVVEWPHRYLARQHDIDARTVVCVLTHDPKFDVPLLEVALRLRVAYVGAMGSRRTNADRARRLTDLGVTAEELARLHAPIGLDLGGRTPEETAISIAAEIISARHGGTGGQLTEHAGPIHYDRGADRSPWPDGSGDPSAAQCRREGC